MVRIFRRSDGPPGLFLQQALATCREMHALVSGRSLSPLNTSPCRLFALLSCRLVSPPAALRPALVSLLEDPRDEPCLYLVLNVARRPASRPRRLRPPLSAPSRPGRAQSPVCLSLRRAGRRVRPLHLSTPHSPFPHLPQLFLVLPSAVLLFLSAPSHWVGAAYFVATYALFLQRFMLTLHFTEHRRLFKKGAPPSQPLPSPSLARSLARSLALPSFRRPSGLLSPQLSPPSALPLSLSPPPLSAEYSALNHLVPLALCPLFGVPSGMYRLHHCIVHHVVRVARMHAHARRRTRPRLHRARPPANARPNIPLRPRPPPLAGGESVPGRRLLHRALPARQPAPLPRLLARPPSALRPPPRPPPCPACPRRAAPACCRGLNPLVGSTAPRPAPQDAVPFLGGV